MDARASLMELLEGLHDPRHAQGKRHPLPALLGLAVVAMLAGQTTYEAMSTPRPASTRRPWSCWGSCP